MFEHSLSEYEGDIYYGLDTNCALLPIWNYICKNNTENCQIAELNIESAENAIIILHQTLSSMERYCEVPSHPSSAESIRRCHNGQSWSTGEGLNEKYFFLNDLMDLYHRSLVRETPLVISGPILIATAIKFSHFKSSIQNHPNRYLFCNHLKTSKVFNYTESCS